jgi:hypothetical protein
VVEPLDPAPVNVNTAPGEVLHALFAEVRQAPNVRTHESDGQPAADAAARHVARRSEGARRGDRDDAPAAEEAPGQGPLRGWQDFAERVMKPRFEAATNDTAKFVWLNLYRNLLTGRDSAARDGHGTRDFTSGPLGRLPRRAPARRAASSIPASPRAMNAVWQALAAPGFHARTRLGDPGTATKTRSSSIAARRSG